MLAASGARAPVPVFTAAGGGAGDALQDLCLRREIRLVDSPRHATVLLVAGRLPRSLVRPLAQVHDQLPHPRATVWWQAGSPSEPPQLVPGMTTVAAGQDAAVEAVVTAHRELLRGVRASEQHVLADEPPARWRGVGPHGQGGEGMMGGRPYGRPMPMTGPDRDGLELDQVRCTVGPFFGPFPPGLALDVVLQGDVVQEATAHPNPFAEPDPSPHPAGDAPAHDVFRRALTDAVPVRDLELARADHHLRAVARVADLHGLRAVARRVVRTAGQLQPGQVAAVRSLRQRLERWRWPRWALAGVGVLDRQVASRTVAGPTARAAGVAVDARSDDPVYADLGFEPVTHQEGDALARVRQLLAETEQALELAARAAGRHRAPGSGVEGPRGALTPTSAGSDTALRLLPDLLAGREWGDSVTTVVSLDLDLDGAVSPAVAAG
ncbi:MAG TPA: hypothetical protein VHF25_00300 [Nitriliruptorales bacterium]|nr:hypothetical protein [Nitriliruptorales bacterium]